MAVCFEPVIEVDPVQVGGDDFFAEFVRFNAQEWDARRTKSFDP